MSQKNRVVTNATIYQNICQRILLSLSLVEKERSSDDPTTKTTEGRTATEQTMDKSDLKPRNEDHTTEIRGRH